MKKTRYVASPWVLAGSLGLCVICADAAAHDFENDLVVDASLDQNVAHYRDQALRDLASKCRRKAIVWSGGVAFRFSDRISPRPVRSRWDRESDSRIRCEGVDVFRQRRVSDEIVKR